MHSPTIKIDTIKDVSKFLLDSVKSHQISEVNIIIHGGEPLLLKKNLFEILCRSLSEPLQGLAEVEFSIQTNALLVDSEWIDLFQKYSVSVGVSLDGTRQQHDKFRIDHKNAGTYLRTVEKIKFMQEAAKVGKIREIGCLSVIDPNNKAEEVYKHLVHELGFTRLDFLLPDLTHETFQENDGIYAPFLCELFDEWLEDDNPRIILRYCSSIVRLLLGKSPLSLDLMTESSQELAITISSDGDLYPDDTLKSSDPNFSKLGINIRNFTLKDFLKNPVIESIGKAHVTLPAPCKICTWRNICNGGQLIHRYNPQTQSFDNPSVFCHDLKTFYAHVSKRLVQHGVNPNHIEQVLLKGL
jgi:uncharacterized protein